MTKAYSLDLRERVIRFVEAGHSWRDTTGRRTDGLGSVEVNFRQRSLGTPKRRPPVGQKRS
jgi:hypothetical protein